MNTTLEADAPSKSVELELGGRVYGRPTLTLNQRAKLPPPPEIGQIFLDDIVENSALLRLGQQPTHDEIYVAYGKDITAVNKRSQQIDTFLGGVLKLSVDRYGEQGKAESEMKLLDKHLSPVGLNVEIELNAERAAWSAPELSEWLKNRFKSEIDRLARRIATKLHYLADHNVIGLVQWYDSSVCKFHYFRWAFDTNTELREERAYEGGWVTYTRFAEAVTKVLRTRHTHHLVNAAMHQLADYKDPLPYQVKALIELAPAPLREHFIVIDGTETLSEQVVEKTDQKIETKVLSVHREDPAMVLGPFVFWGWKVADLKVRPPSKVKKYFSKGNLAVFGSTLVAITMLANAYWAIKVARQEVLGTNRVAAHSPAQPHPVTKK